MATAEQLDDLYSGIRSGDLEVRLASSPDEIDAAQALRYQVFYGEMDAVPSRSCLWTEVLSVVLDIVFRLLCFGIHVDIYFMYLDLPSA